MNLGERIYHLRTQRNMSQGDLADALDVSRQSVSKWENNNAVPDLDKLVKLSELFAISLDELIKGQLPETEPVQPAKQNTPDISSTQRIIGAVLLGCGILLVLMLLWASSLSAIITSLLVAFPFITCGFICLRSRNWGWLYCLLFLYGYLWLPMGIFSPSYINYNAARISQGLHFFWGLWLIVHGELLIKQRKFFKSPRAKLLYFLLLSLSMLLTLLIFRFPSLLPTPGLLHS